MSSSDKEKDFPPETPSETLSDNMPINDIEHAPVVDDPRLWSKKKKTCVLSLVTLAPVSLR